ncbi:MAG: hypothetical protein AABW82_05220 [Nanoarchaeota archaeon]
MEESVERIVVKRLHLKNMVMFGLYKGIIVGLLLALIILIVHFANPALMGKLPGALKVSSTSDAFVLAFIVFVAYIVFSVIASLLITLIYNLASKMGGSIHFGLAEYEKAMP